MSIPLEQGLRLLSFALWLDNTSYSMSIPLEQGLRLEETLKVEITVDIL